jgi:hypothetical protein
LEGDYREEHLFALQTAPELYDSYQFKITACDQPVEKALAVFEAKVRVSAPDLSRLRSAQKRQEALQLHQLEEMTGAGLTKLRIATNSPARTSPLRHFLTSSARSLDRPRARV